MKLCWLEILNPCPSSFREFKKVLSQDGEFFLQCQAVSQTKVFLLTDKLCDRVLRAYGLAYVSTTAPRLLNLLLILYKKKSARSNVSLSVSAVFSFAYCVVPRIIFTRRLHAVRSLTAVPTTQKDLLIQAS